MPSILARWKKLNLMPTGFSPAVNLTEIQRFPKRYKCYQFELPTCKMTYSTVELWAWNSVGLLGVRPPDVSGIVPEFSLSWAPSLLKIRLGPRKRFLRGSSSCVQESWYKNRDFASRSLVQHQNSAQKELE
jgi:hypothetical protein